MKNIWIELAVENKTKRHVNNWLQNIIATKTRQNNPRLGAAMYVMAELVFNRFKTSLIKKDSYDKDDVIQECVLVQVKFIDGATTHDDPFGYLYKLVKARLQSLHDTKINDKPKDYNYLLKKFAREIQEL